MASNGKKTAHMRRNKSKPNKKNRRENLDRFEENIRKLKELASDSKS